ncbi:CRISPR-associated protein Cas5 [Pseudogemmobacter bohemicus]|uniref:CRISPR-associated protein Cas5 n=1 Tax=Pseudogemmobacter bohemicus TaxID=2250708 RepID=UPI000DD3FB55
MTWCFLQPCIQSISFAKVSLSSLPFPSRRPSSLPLSLPFASFRRPFRFGEAVSRPQ